MATKVDSDMFSQKADGIWKMLDNLSESDPEAYKKFLEKTFEEQKELFKPPEPRFCVSTTLLPEIIQHKLYINVCGWNQIPPPKTETDPIPVMAGEIQEICEDTTKYSIVDTIFNPTILDKVAQNSNDRKLLVQLAIDYIGSTKKISISRQYKDLKMKYKGEPQSLKKFVKEPDIRPQQEQTKMVDTPQSLLQQISSIAMSKEEGSSDQPLRLFDRGNETSKVNLIEEVSSSYSSDAAAAPVHKLMLKEADSKLPMRIEVVVELPEVESVQSQELDLTVSKNDMMLCVQDMKDLQITFPKEVDDKKSRAVFNKKRHKLTVTIPVLN